MNRKILIFTYSLILISALFIYLSVIEFYHANLLWAILAVAALLPRWLSPKASSAFKFSSIRYLKTIRPTWRVIAYRYLVVLKCLGIILLVVALARPRVGSSRDKITSEGIAIIMVLDTSGSMKALDFSEGSTRKNRLQVVKEVFSSFVQGEGEMQGRANDLIGLVAFGGYPESKCPLTLDHSALLGVLKQVEIPKEVYDQEGNLINQEEFNTAIGDALATGVERLRLYQGKSRVLILLTDGENTTGVIDPIEAAEIAKLEKIKVYTIGVGTNGRVPFPERNPLDPYGEEILRSRYVKIDEKLLKQIAEITQGRYFNAQDKDALESIYKEIDKLERQEIKVQYLRYNEVYLWFLIPGCLLILLEKFLCFTWLRKVP